MPSVVPIGEIIVRIHSVTWQRSADNCGSKGFLLRMKWKGESGDGSLFDLTRSLDSDRRVYPLMGDSVDSIRSYLIDMRDLVFDIVDAFSHRIVGRCSCDLMSHVKGRF